MNSFTGRSIRNILIISLSGSILSSLHAERLTSSRDSIPRKFTLELSEIKFKNQAAQKAGKEGRIGERLAKAIAVSFRKSKIYKFIEKNDRPLKEKCIYSIVIVLQLYDDNWVLAYQLVLNESMTIVKQDIIEFSNSADLTGTTKVIVQMVDSVPLS